MANFIQEVISDLQNKNVDYSQVTFVLPSKRAGVFLIDQLAKTLKKTIFAPTILSIDEFIESVSGLKYASSTELLFEFYEVYQKYTPKNDQDSLDVFSKWAYRLLQDFNEIDRQLAPSEFILEYLKDIKEIDHWSKVEPMSESIKSYLSFWNRIRIYYSELKKHLINKQIGYQGLVYREAEAKINTYASKSTHTHVFVGFNALTKAEENIIQEMLKKSHTSIYWDIDNFFMENTMNDASLFIRSYKERWPYFEKHPFNWMASNYTTPKQIKTFGVPKNIGQVKYVGELLKSIKKNNGNFNNTAIILADENLLEPLLNSLPEEVEEVNITMGLPLKSIPLATLFEDLFRMHKIARGVYYHKDVELVLSNPNLRPLFDKTDENIAEIIINNLQDNNISYVSHQKLKSLVEETDVEKIDAIFAPWHNEAQSALDSCSKLIMMIKDQLATDKSKNLLALEYLYRFNMLFNELRRLNDVYPYMTNVASVWSLYRDLLKTETLDFKGEPLVGLQIMGMLETRVLDFETIIITSVNEGVLPAGKTNNSFIPFDVKIENDLPTYKEKDAVYTYHFYRLLQRAKNIHLIYNTEPDVLMGGEKSRFISQLEVEQLHSIEHYIVAPEVSNQKSTTRTIKKTSPIIEKIKQLAASGLSPSSLSKYVRNPIDFYYDKILKIKTFEDVEETIAANTLGSVIHETLESFYKSYINQTLTKLHLEQMLNNIDDTISQHFKTLYKEGDMTKGKNLIAFEIAKRYVHNFLNKELESVEKGHQIKIIALEKEVSAELKIPELDFPVRLKGTVDRIDEFDGTLRIIDYKTGRVEQSKVEIVNWEDLTTDYDKYSKSFQLLSYAYMLNDETPFTTPVEAGIISFKNLQGDCFLKFAKKDKYGNGAKKDQLIAAETLEAFFMELKSLVLEICNPDIDFEEKEV